MAAMFAAVPVADAAAVKRAFGSRNLEQGMKGRDVRVLQDFLTKWGLPTAVDGRYGRSTQSRVRSWERRIERRVDGRMTVPDAQELRRAVEAGERRPDIPIAPASAPAPAPVEKATIDQQGLAVAPASAPQVVKDMIAAGNEIHDLPYRRGGGHGPLEDTAFDCSGSLSYVFRKVGLLDQALDSTGFAGWEDAGPGTWVTTYGNPTHAYMVIAGLRFDTSGRADDGSRWDTEIRPSAGYVERHPSGL